MSNPSSNLRPSVSDMNKLTIGEVDKSDLQAHVESVTPRTTPPEQFAEEEFKTDLRFWLVFGALCSCSLLSALDLVGIGNAAPTIIHDLHGSDFTWVSAAYALAAAACIPLSSNLAEIFGRRVVSLSGIVLFAIGSAICGSAPQMTPLIIGRAIQGTGSGITSALNSMIITDLVPLRHRGAYAGITALVFTVGGAAGPFVTGALSEKASWRWIFYLNLPLSGIAFTSVFFFLRLKRPHGKFVEKLIQVDWIGNILITASSCSCMISLTLGGAYYSWTSARVLVPLIVGLVGIVITLLYESRCPQKPVIPLSVLSNRTSLLGYLAIFIQGMVSLAMAYYLPTWFQAVKMASPVQSGLYVLPITLTTSPFAIAQGIIISKTGRYRPVILIGWAASVLGLGLLILLNPSTSIGVLIPIQILMGLGTGFLYATTVGVLAPLQLSMNGPAMALQVFVRSFSQAWGIAIGGTILQNSLGVRLQGINEYTEGDSAYVIIPSIPGMSEPLRTQVREAFSGSFRNVWIAFTICNAVGFLTFFGMKNFTLAKTTDGKWGIDRAPKKEDRVPNMMESEKQ